MSATARPAAPTSPAALSRRRLLGAIGRWGGGLGAAALPGRVAGAEAADAAAASRPSGRPALAWRARSHAQMPPPAPEVHLLNRCAWGPSAADLARVQALGIAGWIEEQLDPWRIDASAVEGDLAARVTGWST